jgi:putative SOS response-associated peptidase YedK
VIKIQTRNRWLAQTQMIAVVETHASLQISGLDAFPSRSYRFRTMCGRYDFFPSQFTDFRMRFNLPKNLPLFKASFNIAPGKDVPVIVRHGDRNVVKLMRWGLVPSWAQDPAIGNQMINARCETLDQKPSFKQLLGSRRCLVPADGFYEWARVGKRKIPMRIRMKDRRPFTMAGLWDVWRDPEAGELSSFTIITTQANKLLRPIHDRMPLILDPLVARQWLDPTAIDTRMISAVMVPFPSEPMEAYEVSRLVNDANPRRRASTPPSRNRLVRSSTDGQGIRIDNVAQKRRMESSENSI